MILHKINGKGEGCFVSNIMSNMRKSVVSSAFPNTEKRVEKPRCSQVFLTNFEVFGYLMKDSFNCLIQLLKALTILREIQSKGLRNFKIIRMTYPNVLHCRDFLFFLFMN